MGWDLLWMCTVYNTQPLNHSAVVPEFNVHFHWHYDMWIVPFKSLPHPHFVICKPRQICIISGDIVTEFLESAIQTHIESGRESVMWALGGSNWSKQSMDLCVGWWISLLNSRACCVVLCCTCFLTDLHLLQCMYITSRNFHRNILLL